MKIVSYIRTGLLTFLLFSVYQLHNSLGFGWYALSLYRLDNLLMFLYYYITFELGVSIFTGVVKK